MVESPDSQGSIRDALGRIKPGQSLNPKGEGAGRKPLPECFTKLEGLALAQLAAMGTGVVLDELIPAHLHPEEHAAALAALQQSATETVGKLRLEAADRMIDRTRGKPKEQVEHTGEVTKNARLIVEFRTEPPREKEIEGSLAQPKALTTHDAE